MGQIDRSMLQYSHSSELFAVLFVYIDKEQLDKLEFDKEEPMKHYNIITAILFLILAGLWLYLGVVREEEYYFFLSLLWVIVSIVHFIRHMKEKRK